MDTMTLTPAERRPRERAEVAAVLLLMQSVFGLLSLLGMLVMAALFPVLTPAGLLVAAGFMVPLLGAIGVARGWRWARRIALIWQGITLFGLFVNLLLALLPPVQMELTLTGIITGLLLPVSVIALLHSESKVQSPRPKVRSPERAGS